MRKYPHTAGVLFLSKGAIVGEGSVKFWGLYLI